MLLLIHRLHREVELAAAERKLDLNWLDNRYALTEAVLFLVDRRATVNNNNNIDDDVFVFMYIHCTASEMSTCTRNVCACKLLFRYLYLYLYLCLTLKA